MPNAVVKSYAKRTGKSAEHVEHWWKEAEAEADKKFNGKKGPQYWAYVNGIVKRRGKIDESFTFKEFIELLGEDIASFTKVDQDGFDQLSETADDINETKVENHAVEAALKAGNIIGVWYPERNVGSSSSNFTGKDVVSYTQQDPNWPFPKIS